MNDTATTNMPVEGDIAPDFELPDDTGAIRRLSDQRGRWTVLYFYPKDDTPGCTTEACEFRDANELISQRNAEVWGVSVLNSGSKAAFKAKLGLNFPLLADEDHAVAERYGVWVEKQNYGRSYMGIQRATFLVDPEGRIAQSWPKVKPEGHAAQVLAALEDAQATGVGTIARKRT
jgi:peroxiredoxin Q/BCP